MIPLAHAVTVHGSAQEASKSIKRLYDTVQFRASSAKDIILKKNAKNASRGLDRILTIADRQRSQKGTVTLPQNTSLTCDGTLMKGWITASGDGGLGGSATGTLV